MRCRKFTEALQALPKSAETSAVKAKEGLAYCNQLFEIERLQVARSTYYYEAKIRDDQDEELTDLILDIFKKSRNNSEKFIFSILSSAFLSF